MMSDQQALDHMAVVTAEKHAAAQGQRHESARVGNSDGVDLGSMKLSDMRSFERGFVPAIELTGQLAALAEYEAITSRHEDFTRRSRIKESETGAQWDDAILHLARGDGSLADALKAGVAVKKKRERVVDEAEVFRDAATTCVGLANNWARTNYAGLVAEFDNVFQARLAVACEAATILPDSVISAETAVRASEEIAAAWATIDNANQLWFHCLRSLSIEKTIMQSPRGHFESSELFRSIQFPEKLTEQTRRMPAPLQLISAVADDAAPGIFTTEQAKRTDTRIRAGVPDLGLLSKGRLDVTKPLSSQTVNDSGAVYMATSHGASSAINARTHGASSARRGMAL